MAELPINSLEKAHQLVEKNNLADAESLLKSILQVTPQHGPALFLLAQVAIKSAQPEAALKLLAQASMIMPDSPEPIMVLAQQMAELNRFDHADACFQRLLSKFGKNAECHFATASYLTARGNQQAAKQHLEETLRLQPGHCGALLALAQKEKIEPSSPIMTLLVERLNVLLASENTPSQELIKIHYALGKAYEDLESCEQAFDHYKSANQLQLQLCEFRVQKMLPLFESLKKTFSTADEIAIAERSSDLVPIFIVGMPRSGSTLLEQMLSAHSSISSAGEVDYIARYIVAEMEKVTQHPYPEALESIESQELEVLAQKYLAQLQSRAPNAKFIIDKLPANFQSVGLIQKVLPQAIIVDLVRDPMATGFSIYKNYFAENEPYFCDLKEFAEYYLIYKEIMQFWKTANAQNIFHISYEQLVEDPKSIVTSILDACGLQWQNKCLEFYQRESYVTTLSDQQVRQPVYQRANEKWHQYQVQLEPLQQLLADEN